MEKDKTIFMCNLRYLRKVHGLTQDELAENCGLTRRTISYYENNPVSPPIDKLQAIAKVLSVSIDDLLNKKIENPIVKNEKLDQRFLKRFVKIKQLPKKQQDNIIQYIDTILRNFELEKKQEKENK